MARRISSGSTEPGRVDGGHRVGLDQVEDRRVGDETGLDDLGHPGHEFVGRQGLQHRQVDEHRRGLVEGADEVLARVGVDPGLAADGGVDHGQQRGRDVHDVDAPQPGRRGEARHVGGRAAAETDDGVLAADSDAAQHFPDEPDDRQVLARLGVGDLDAVRVDALGGQVGADGLGGAGQHRLMQDGDLVAGAQQLPHLGQQSGADDHRVGRIDGHLDGHRGGRRGLGHLRTPARRAASAAGVAGVTGADSRGLGAGAGGVVAGTLFGLGRRRSAPGRAAPPRRRRVLQPRDDVAHHRAGVAAVGVDPDGRDAPVQRHPVVHQLAVLLGVVRTGEQRA